MKILFLLCLTFYSVFSNESCSNDDFFCGSSDPYKCISKSWKCDGNEDCDNGSDEEGCPAFSCNVNEFQCTGYNLCIDKSFRCDGKRDCIDNSDERNCNKIESCSDTPEMCSQICRQIANKSECICYNGHKKVGDKCIPISDRDKIHLLYASHKKMFYVDISNDGANSDNTVKLVENDKQFLSFDISYLGSNSIIYTSVIENGHVFVKFHPFEKPIKFSKVSYPNSSFYSVAVDSVKNLLFWSDEINRSISVMNVTSQDTLQIISSDLNLPIGLQVDPILSRIFWINYQEGFSKIEMSNMDGSNRKTLLSNKILRRPTSLALDLENDRLYWSDIRPGSISYLDLNTISGENPKTFLVIESKEIQPFSIAVFENKVFWADWHQNRIYSADKLTGKGIVAVEKASKASSIKVFSEQSLMALAAKEHDRHFRLCNNCSFSCLPLFGQMSYKCFGSAKPIPKAVFNKSLLWLWLIPTAVLIVAVSLFVKRRSFRKPNNDDSMSTRTLLHVQYLDDEENVRNVPEPSDSEPIVIA